MQAFEYCVPTRIVFGKDSVEKLPEQLKKSGASRVLVVYGGHSAKKSGLLDRVLALLGGAGVSYDTLGTRTWGWRARASKRQSPWTRS